MTRLCMNLAVAVLGSPLLSASAVAQVSIEDVEAYYADPGVFLPAEPTAHSYATRYPSLAANRSRLAYLREGQAQIALRSIAGDQLDLVAAPGLLDSARDYSLSLDGQTLAFASDAPLASKSSCGREVSLLNLLTGTRTGFPGAACLSQPSRPYLPQQGQSFGYSSNIKPGGLPSPSNSYDVYRRRSPPPGGKGEEAVECLTCAQDPSDSGTIAVVNFSAEPISTIAYRENKNLWMSPDGSRLAFVYSIAYQTCPVGDADCGESGIVVADQSDAGLQVKRTLRSAARNRFFDLHGSSDGNRLVFSTRAPLLQQDDDDALDVYLYEVSSQRLTLLSEGLSGSSNDPRISGNGRYAVFASDSIARDIPAPTDVEVFACTSIFDPQPGNSRHLLVDLRAAVPRRALLEQSPVMFANSCYAASARLREGLDIDHTGRQLALTTRAGLAASDSNEVEDVYLVANHFARDEVFDHGFD